MKHIYFLFLILILSLPSTARVLEKTNTADISDNQQIREVVLEYISAKNNTEATELRTELFGLLKETRASNGKISQNILKSATTKSHKLDSLLAQRWNETTGQLETSQLEKWIWNEKGNGKFWELYDKDTLTGHWFPNDKEEYAWDESGNKITHIDYDPDSLTGGWRKNAIEDYTYNANGDQTSHLLRFVDRSTGAMVNSRKTETTYDYAENIQTDLHQDYDTITGEWVNDVKQTYSTDIDENINFDYILSEEWNITLQKWETVLFMEALYDENGNTISIDTRFYEFFMFTKSEYTFDENGNQTGQIDYEWDFVSSQFIYDSKYVNEYNAVDNIAGTTKYVWDTTENDWITNEIIEFEYDSLEHLIFEVNYGITDNASVPGSKVEYSRNSSGLMTSNITYNWDTITDSWIGEYKRTKTYAANGKLIYRDEWVWDIQTNSWIGQYKENYISAVNGNNMMENRWIWNTDTNGWIPEYQYDFNYDLSILFSDIVFPPDYSFSHISNLTDQEQYFNMMTRRTYSELKDGQLTPTETITLYYSENTATGTPHLTDNKLKVYPNPATEFVVFDTGNNTPAIINLYSLQGKKTLSRNFTGNMQLYLNQLNNQIYIYEVIQGDKISRGKFIKHQ
jgi:hypothetical protein